MTALTRMDVVTSLTNEHDRRLTVLDWWRDGLAALDDPTKQELLLWLQRQSGKSQFCAAVAISELLTRPGSYTVYMAASADQSEAIFTRKVSRPLARLAKELGLASALRFTKRGVENLANGAVLEVLATTDSTSPGRTVTLLILDEARYIPNEVYASMAPSVIGSGGTMLIASTAGPPRGFFFELTQNPTEATWLYRAETNENPEASKGVLDFIKRRLGLVSPNAALRELGNEFADDGDELLPWPLIEGAIDDTLGETTSTLPAFAAGDLSRRRDLTSRVVVVREGARRPEAADHLVVRSLRSWDPKQSATGEVPFEEVRADAATLPARFPGLVKLYVDEGAEGGSLLPFCRTHPTLSLLVEGFVASANSNMEIWSALSARLQAQTISIPRHERLISELRSLRRESFLFGSKWRVVDSSRRFHRDISFSLALATWAAGAAQPGCPYHCGDPTCTGFHLLTDRLLDDYHEGERQRSPNPNIAREIGQMRELVELMVVAVNARQLDEARGRQAQIDALIAKAPVHGRPKLEALLVEWIPDLLEEAK